MAGVRGSSLTIQNPKAKNADSKFSHGTLNPPWPPGTSQEARREQIQPIWCHRTGNLEAASEKNRQQLSAEMTSLEANLSQACLDFTISLDVVRHEAKSLSKPLDSFALLGFLGHNRHQASQPNQPMGNRTKTARNSAVSDAPRISAPVAVERESATAASFGLR